MSDGQDPCRSICSLSPAEFDERVAALRRDVVPKIRRVAETAGGVAFFFEADGETRDLVERFVEFERRCCATLEFTVDVSRDSSGESALRVSVAGEGAAAFAALAGRETAG